MSFNMPKVETINNKKFRKSACEHSYDRRKSFVINEYLNGNISAGKIQLTKPREKEKAKEKRHRKAPNNMRSKKELK